MKPEVIISQTAAAIDEKFQRLFSTSSSLVISTLDRFPSSNTENGMVVVETGSSYTSNIVSHTGGTVITMSMYLTWGCSAVLKYISTDIAFPEVATAVGSRKQLCI